MSGRLRSVLGSLWSLGEGQSDSWIGLRRPTSLPRSEGERARAAVGARGEPRLDHHRVIWYASCPPDDRQSAGRLRLPSHARTERR
jgi:hypothetical protein